MNRRATFLTEMGIGPVWTLRDKAPPAALPKANDAYEAVPLDDVPMFDDIPLLDEIPPHFLDAESHDEDAPTRIDLSGMGWEQLEATMAQCTACGLCKGRKQTVPGVGDRDADWLFVGEGPGTVEDQQGEPFVGPSGKLLDNMLLAMGLRRGDNAYIANVVKCRPSDGSNKDRAPTPAEASACRPYLERQIALIQPKIIVAVGRVAATTLLATDPQTSLASLRGKSHVYRAPDGTEIALVATYHPAYLLRTLSDKRKAWEDLCLALKILPED